jgi:hypothetical protein
MRQPYPRSQRGDGVEMSTKEVRGAERHGFIWILTVSLTGGTIALVASWLLAHSGHFF